MNFDLLRPVVFANLKVGDKLVSREGREAVVVYMGPDFAVIRFQDNSEDAPFGSYLESEYWLKPLCWVEDKPVYPGDELYRPEVEGDVAIIASHTTRSEPWVEYLHFSNVADANEYADNRRGYLTWTKPEPQRVSSFQVEGQDVFPGDTVYYYGVNSKRWGVAVTVEANGCVLNEFGQTAPAGDYEQGVATFRLKPMIVIGDHLVPMPVRDGSEMKLDHSYYAPSMVSEKQYSAFIWFNDEFDRRALANNVVHKTPEAAVAHTEAFIALSKKED